MTTRFGMWAACLSITMGTAGTSFATVGGPESAEILGYDSAEAKVFYRIVPHGDGGMLPATYYFHLAGARPRTPARVDWTRHVKSSGRTGYQDAVQRLLGRLLPLDSIPASRIEARFQTERTDRGGSGGYEYPRFLRRGILRCGDYRAPVTVLAYHDANVRVIAGYAIPGGEFMLAIVSFIGIPYESAYRVEVPVILSRRSAHSRRLEWARW